MGRGERGTADLSFERLAGMVEAMGTPRVLVVGDLMLDRYTWGEAGRVSPEAPVLVLQAGRSEERPGGAASVATLLRALEAEVVLAGVVGDDEAGGALRRILEGAGVDLRAVRVDRDRPTTLKHRLMGVAEHSHSHQILRLDAESTRPVAGAIEAELVGRICRAMPEVDAVLVSDYAKGVCTPGLLGATIAQARELGKVVLVDPGRGVDYRCYRDAHAITPNRHEAAAAVGRPLATVAEALAAAGELCRAFRFDAAIVTLDRDGIVRAGADGRSDHFPCRPHKVYDITGAGDVVLATLGLALASGLDEADAIALANVAGGIEVESVGVVPVTRLALLADLALGPAAGIAPTGRAKVVASRALAALAGGFRARGERVVFTNGCFDLLHPGHLRVLTEARTRGDRLIVGVNSDASVRRLKGPGRPVVAEADRLAMVAALGVVDHACLFDAPTPIDLIAAVRPDVLVKGGDYAPDAVLGRELVEGLGGEVVVVPLSPGWSTSTLVDRLRAGSTPAPAR